MDIKTELLREYSKPQAVKIANYIGADANRFKELMGLFFMPEYRINQRAAWVMTHCVDMHPELIKGYIEPMINNLTDNVSVPVKRNTFRVLQNEDLPDSVLGIATDMCFKILVSQKEPIAIKVFSMTMLHNICKKIPELKNEFKVLIEDQMPFASAGFKSRAKKILATL